MLWGRVRGNTQPAATLGQATGRGRNRGIEILNTTTQLIATLCNVDSFATQTAALPMLASLINPVN
jgi:hypothetical protein